MKKHIYVACIVAALAPLAARAAVGCTLNDPDKDVRRLFPSYTSYKTEFNSLSEHGGVSLKAEVEKKLGDRLDAEYESVDVPYACYTIYKAKRLSATSSA